MSDTPSRSATAFGHFLATLEKAAATLHGPLGAKSERERAEGYRHLLRLVSVATEMMIEKGDRSRPEFTRWVTPHRKLLGDNPWTIYDSALLNHDMHYVIRGRRGTSLYLGFCVYTTDAQGNRGIASNLDDNEMEFAADGSFELHVSALRPAGAINWLSMNDIANDIMVRQYFSLDQQGEEAASYTIEACPPQSPPPALTEDEFVGRLDAAGAFVFTILNVEATISALAAQATPALLRDGLTYDKKQGEADGATIDFSYVAKAMPSRAILYSGYWINDLGDDEVILIEGQPPKARYWSVQFLSRWMESPDFRHFDVFYNQANTRLEADGSFRIVIAHSNPGAANWLDTTGLRSGNVCVRALKCEQNQLDVTFRRLPRGPATAPIPPMQSKEEPPCR